MNIAFEDLIYSGSLILNATEEEFEMESFLLDTYTISEECNAMEKLDFALNYKFHTTEGTVIDVLVAPFKFMFETIRKFIIWVKDKVVLFWTWLSSKVFKPKQTDDFALWKESYTAAYGRLNTLSDLSEHLKELEGVPDPIQTKNRIHNLQELSNILKKDVAFDELGKVLDAIIARQRSSITKEDTIENFKVNNRPTMTVTQIDELEKVIEGVSKIHAQLPEPSTLKGAEDAKRANILIQSIGMQLKQYDHVIKENKSEAIEMAKALEEIDKDTNNYLNKIPREHITDARLVASINNNMRTTVVSTVHVLREELNTRNKLNMVYNKISSTVSKLMILTI